MDMFTVKAIHVFCAYATGIGFLLRGVLIILQSSISQHGVARTLPHIVDTCLLVSGLTMAFGWSISPSSSPWLIAKIIALFGYIACGLLMIRWGETKLRRWVGLICGAIMYFYIIGAAHSKSPFSLLIFL